MRIFLGLAIAAKLVLAALICWYFWEATMLAQLKQLPIWLLVLCVVYILLQMFTRRVSNAHNWWDWVYYIGLLSIMIPVTLADHENEKVFHLVADIGTICLILPVLADGYFFVTKPSKTN